MNKNWTVLEALRYTRHDWLNRLQLIKGNLSLGKTDQAERIMDEIVLDMQQEAILSNLQLPQFAELLLTHNWKGCQFRVEYEVVHFPAGMTLDDHLLTQWVSEFFERLNQAAMPYYENCLYVTIDSTNEAVRFLFHFNGIIENMAEIKEWLNLKGYPDQIIFESKGENDWLVQALFYLKG